MVLLVVVLLLLLQVVLGLSLPMLLEVLLCLLFLAVLFHAACRLLGRPTQILQLRALVVQLPPYRAALSGLLLCPPPPPQLLQPRPAGSFPSGPPPQVLQVRPAEG